MSGAVKSDIHLIRPEIGNCHLSAKDRVCERVPRSRFLVIGVMITAMLVGTLAPTPVASERGGCTMTLSAKSISAHAVEFTVKTSIPLPVVVMAEVSLKGQGPNDVWIGYSKRVRLKTPEQTFVLDTRTQKDKLPAGDYLAQVSFYPRWGAKNGNPKASRISHEITASDEVSLHGSGKSSRNVSEQRELHKWVMDNVSVGMAWNEKSFVRRLGSYESIKAGRNLHRSFYFPKADVTILVNTHNSTISTWRNGRVAN